MFVFSTARNAQEIGTDNLLKIHCLECHYSRFKGHDTLKFVFYESFDVQSTPKNLKCFGANINLHHFLNFWQDDLAQNSL